MGCNGDLPICSLIDTEAHYLTDPSIFREGAILKGLGGTGHCHYPECVGKRGGTTTRSCSLLSKTN
jgi:hypothetical protein